VNHRAVTARDGTIWVLGGIESAITPLPVNTVFIYDPSTDSWSEGPSMLSGRKEFGAAVDRQGRIYVLGGEVDDKGVPDSTEIYDPATGRWEYGPPRPSHGCSRGCLVGGCAIDPCDRIYLIGGWSGGAGHQMDDLDRFDPSTGTWEQLEGMPEPTAGLAAVSTANGKIFVIGGERGDWCATEQVFILDIPTEECVPHFMRGDVDDNGLLTIGDAIMILEYLLLRGDPPSCADTADTDNDGQFTMADAIALLNYEFCGGAPLAEPGYSCGPDPDTPPEPWPAEDCDYRSCR